MINRNMKTAERMRPLLRLCLLVLSCAVVYIFISTVTSSIRAANPDDEDHYAALSVRKIAAHADGAHPRDVVRDPLKKEQKSDPGRQMIIYAATKFFNMDITTKRFLSECHSTKGSCRISEDPSDLAKADAVLFHNADYNPSKVPKPRLPNRPHVLWSLESPQNDQFRPESHVINWTMCPRMDADIWYPYGHFAKLDEPIEYDLDSIWASKDHSKTATWLASNCYTTNRRKELIDSMMKHGIKADLWGRCGKPAPLNCDGVGKQGEDCVIQLVKPYKFYFSIENSNCKDYVTEKFYETLHSRMAVPIVLKRKIYEDVGAPPSSFISIDDFKSIEELVVHVNKVKDSKELYLSYHQWRNTHKVHPEHDDTTGFCELCRRLQGDDRGSKSYENLRKWNAEGMCDQRYADNFL